MSEGSDWFIDSAPYYRWTNGDIEGRRKTTAKTVLFRLIGSCVRFTVRTCIYVSVSDEGYLGQDRLTVYDAK